MKSKGEIKNERPNLINGFGVITLAILLLLLLLIASIIAIRYGTSNITSTEILQVIRDQIFGTNLVSEAKREIVWELRIPRVITALLVGAALALSGTILQTLVKNPVADPYILGAGPGAAFGAVFILVTPLATHSISIVPIAAFIGAMAALGIVIVLGRKNGVLSPNRMILSGIAIGYLLNSASNFLQLRTNPARLNGVLHWLLGSFSGSSWREVQVPAILMFVTSIAVLLYAQSLNALSFGDDVATTLGINVGTTRLILLICASILTGCSVALAGGVVFVGLLVPHVCKLLVGYDHRKVIPLSLLAGSTLLIIVDLLSRTILAPNEIPVSIFTALLGAPFFLWLLRKEK